jgi:subtilisin family serine protease
MSTGTGGIVAVRQTRLLGVVVIGAALAAGPPSVAVAAAPGHSGLCDLLSRVLRLDCGPEAGASAAPEPAAADDPSAVETPVSPTGRRVRYDPGRLTVTFKRGATRPAIDRSFDRAGVTPERAIPPIRAFLVRVAPSHRAAALASLNDSPLVASAEREPFVHAFAITPDDEDWPQQWGLRLAGFPDAWSVTRGSSHVVVAVLDTGVERSHPELRGALVPGYDFVNGDADPNDDQGHGTPVAGIIGARGNNHAGVAGVCWSCSIMPVKVLNSEGVGLDSVIAAGIVWAVDHGARVINLSLGGPGNTEDLENAIAYAVQKNAIVVAAAGNNGTTEQSFPGASPLAVSVAGTNASDRRYSWSNYGSWVRVAAPGCNVAPVRGGRDGVFCGTSSATPIVSGLAGLALSANPGATPVQIADALQRTAVPIPGVVQAGRIQAGRAVSFINGRSAAPEIRATFFRGTIQANARTRVFSLPVAAGRVTATLTSGKRQKLSLSLFVGEASRPLVQLEGRSPLRVARTVLGGTVRLVVHGAAGTRFVLKVEYAPSDG